MLDLANSLMDKSLEKLRAFFDFSTNSLDQIVKKFGSEGYYIYGFLSNSIFFFSSLIIKLYPQVDWTICVIIRGIATFIGSYIITAAYKQELYYKGDEFKYVTIRNVLMSIQQLFFFYVILVVPLKITWIINNTGPIYVFVLSYFMMGTLLSMKDIVFLIISLIGINIITAPQLVMKAVSMFLPITVEDAESEMDSYQMLIAILFFLSLSMWAFGIVIAKFSKTATALSINNNLGVNLIAFGSFALFAKSDTLVLPSLSELFFVFAFLGVPTFISTILYIHGTLIAEDQGKFSLTNYIPVFYSYFYQIMFKGRVPRFLEILGVFLTFYGLIKVVIKPKPKKQDENQQKLLNEQDIAELNNLASQCYKNQELQDFKKPKTQEQPQPHSEV